MYFYYLCYYVQLPAGFVIWSLLATNYSQLFMSNIYYPFLCELKNAKKHEINWVWDETTTVYNVFTLPIHGIGTDEKRTKQNINTFNYIINSHMKQE